MTGSVVSRATCFSAESTLTWAEMFFRNAKMPCKFFVLKKTPARELAIEWSRRRVFILYK